MRAGVGVMFLLGAGLAVLAAAFLLGTPRDAVDWRELRAVVLESDDWGFAGFAPDAAAWDGIDRAALAPGRFPAAYWGSTLEDSAAVAALARVLAAVVGRDGRPAVLQPNCIMFSLVPGPDTTWTQRAYPDFPPAYRRPGLETAVDAARAQGVWHPELHGAWHYDPAQRRARARATPVAARATAQGITVFPGAEQARELDPHRPLLVRATELDAARGRFAAVFGRPPASVIAPDYTWGPGQEDLWASRGLRVIQAKREQRDPSLPAGRTGRAMKWLRRRWEALRHPDRVYLERNCRLETAQQEDADAVGRACVAQVRQAWRAGRPAVVETHRVNYAHLDAATARQGRRVLGDVLRLLAEADPAPTFLTDAEVAQLARRGVSAVARGGRIVVRNPGRTRRVVAVAPEALAAAGGPAPLEGPLLLAVPAGTTFDLVPGSAGWQRVPRAR